MVFSKWRLRFFFFFSSRRRHTRLQGDWSSDVCSSDLAAPGICAGSLRSTVAELNSESWLTRASETPADSSEECRRLRKSHWKTHLGDDPTQLQKTNIVSKMAMSSGHSR